MNLQPWIEAAGAFPVVKNPCPHYMQPIDLNAPPADVLHTTEGASEEGAESVFHSHFAPHFLVGKNTHRKGVVIEQLVPVGFIGAAIRKHNELARVQIEVVGFSKETPWIFDDETLAQLSALMKVLRDLYGIPLTRPWPDGVYGRAGSTPHRNEGKFGKIAGWFGHGDVPSPDTHWDPGNLQWSKIFDRAKALDATHAIA